MFVLIVAIVVVLRQVLLVLRLISILGSLQILGFVPVLGLMLLTVFTAISISVAVTITLPSSTVLFHIIMINTIVAIIVTLVSKCIMNVTIITASNNASISIPAPVLL